MKRLFVLLLLLSGLAQAAPRVGTHDGYTRLVFDLPAASSLSTTRSGSTVTVQLSVALKAEQGTLSGPATRYAIQGKAVSLTLATAQQPVSAQIYPAAAGQPNRLVIDLPAASRAPVATRPPTTATVKPASTAQKPRLTVVIDPGHGGVDSGMASTWVTEKQVTLDVGLRVRAYLEAHGVKVIMTRDRDTQLSRDKQTDLEMRSRLAKAGTVNAYISIHVNAGNSAAQGIETYYFGSSLGSSNRSLAVSENGGGNVGETLTRQASSTAQNLVGDLLSQAKLAFSANLARSVQSALIGSTSAVNRGVHSDAFYVIRNPTVPAILTEIGFGSNPAEGARLAQPAYRDRVAVAIARGILSFLKADE
ncbi:N-acetylmuramoyl-L-alanine amidase [Deinococcus sonorensis]|uniref:N-acetylmuramoyl-L-alanine amidase n=2 Tax=Deinococcus sonorensis TaxID=309891 RepID=A0AAU7U9Y7_9DEIO